MDKKEFTAKVALTLLVTHGENISMEEVASYTKYLAEELFGNGVVEDGESIEVLIKEIDRIAEEEKEKKEREKPQWSWSKSGFASIVRRVCESNGIKTVDELTSMGRNKFRVLDGVGEKCIASVDKALFNLYGINAW